MVTKCWHSNSQNESILIPGNFLLSLLEWSTMAIKSAKWNGCSFSSVNSAPLHHRYGGTARFLTHFLNVCCSCMNGLPNWCRLLRMKGRNGMMFVEGPLFPACSIYIQWVWTWSISIVPTSKPLLFSPCISFSFGKIQYFCIISKFQSSSSKIITKGMT